MQEAVPGANNIASVSADSDLCSTKLPCCPNRPPLHPRSSHTLPLKQTVILTAPDRFPQSCLTTTSVSSLPFSLLPWLSSFTSFLPSFQPYSHSTIITDRAIGIVKTSVNLCKIISRTGVLSGFTYQFVIYLFTFFLVSLFFAFSLLGVLVRFCPIISSYFSSPLFVHIHFLFSRWIRAARPITSKPININSNIVHSNRILPSPSPTSLPPGVLSRNRRGRRPRFPTERIAG